MITKTVLKNVLLEQSQGFLPSRLVERSALAKLKNLCDEPDIIIITGLRRCGKSTVMQEVRKFYEKADYFINFDDDRLASFELSDFQLLYETFIELWDDQETFFLDEIQNIPEWERFVRRLHDQGKKVWVTGSNASMFSRELGTRLTGRYIQYEMFPYSYSELVNNEHPKLINMAGWTTVQKGKLLATFNAYEKSGGIPQFVSRGNPAHLHHLYEGLLYRDIITRYSVSSDKIIKTMVHYLASHVGKEFSYSRLAKRLNIGNASTISSYCGYLEGSYLCFFINRYSDSLAKQIQGSKKCYFIDHALAKYVGFRISEDRGRLLENLVFIELKRRHAEIFYHQEKKECDFVMRRNGRIDQAVQVCLSLDSEETRQREIAGLVEAMNTYSLHAGLILTESQEEELILNDDCKISILPVWKWLLSPDI